MRDTTDKFGGRQIGSAIGLDHFTRLPPYSAGDLFFIKATNEVANDCPVMPSGFTLYYSGVENGQGFVIAHRTAVSSNEHSWVWKGATKLELSIWTSSREDEPPQHMPYISG